MKCTVIDDEPFAVELIKDYILKTPFLELGECFCNPFKALTYLTGNHTDLIFLDINMPELTGLQLLKSLPEAPRVIFTTAYPEFGAESYDYNAIDYLLKPVRYERFLKAVNKAVTLIKQMPSENLKSDSPSEKTDFIYVKSGIRLIKIKPSEILYVEASGNYMTFHTTEKRFLSLLTMQEAMDLLPEDMFARIHKSFIVSLNHIDAIEKHDVIIKGKPLPIGITYKEQFLTVINKSGKLPW
jgi:two-component system, LytTR family, response regulator